VNFALSDEQELLREAARGALSRFRTVEEARGALEGAPVADLWPTAREAGWAGLLIAEEHGGAGLGAMDAMLVFEELGRALAAVPLLGHVPATLLLDRAEDPDAELLAALATGERRAALVAARPPSDLEPGWTVEGERGITRIAAPEIDQDGTVRGTVSWVPDAPGADVLVVVGEGGRVAAVPAADALVQALWRYDATRSLGHVTFDGTRGRLLDLDDDTVAAAWYLAQALLAAESLGGADLALETSVRYAKERFTFGRAIGSYQAIKHALVEMLRLADNARSLMYYTGWAAADHPVELALAASAFRSAAGRAVEFATRTQINVHGGIGATWEHDAPLYFRRAQLSRRLLGGTADAADRVADELFAVARAGASPAAV
jgi:alkylation response protein AidB-like acyl-CoA dehydrogenase